MSSASVVSSLHLIPIGQSDHHPHSASGHSFIPGATPVMVACDKQQTKYYSDLSGVGTANMDSSYVLHQIVISALVVAGFICTKTILDNVRRRTAKINVIIIGGGPIGLSALLIAARCSRVARIVLYEELCRKAMFCTPHQIAFDVKSVHFLKRHGVDFDNIEGCWDTGCFYTRLAVFQEYMLDMAPRVGKLVDIRTGTKFTSESLRDLERISGRKLVIACDGSSGQAAQVLGLSDEFVQQSCKAYGAVAALDRPSECQVPLPERHVHNLHFDLTAYGSDTSEVDGYQGFSFKVFGTSRNRYMTLSIPKCESPLVKSLRTVLDRSMMRNIFLKCFNTYKSSSEPNLSDPLAVKYMKFSPRLFEIRLSQRVENTAYFQEPDMFVLAEGEAARCYNIHTGMDVNVGLRGLMALPNFLSVIAVADTDHAILKALTHKNRDAERVCREFTRTGLAEYHLSRSARV
ncbi:hypothetical protein EGW08_000025 [Elysia chlorotica]|uniref:FAD-binding domain-containing protein n=1 Tax=Elysia chlorotica TaxID=188477 RepID=A0A3S1I4S0_ELYCH|nr:hypothetical protein EGW08_000025 [Elysia chlorotica]